MIIIIGSENIMMHKFFQAEKQ